MGGLITALVNPIGTLLERLIPDKAQQDAAKNQLAQMALSGELAAVAGQIQVNLAEAGNRSMFVSGWRPFVGWVCASGLAAQFIIAPIATWVAALAHHPIVFPSLDMGTLLTLLAGMLGLGGLRTYEKLNSVAAK